MKISKNFDDEEFQCPHCKKVKVNPKLIEKLEEIRKVIGNLPINITSGYRCKIYNDLIEGDINSPHLSGEGCDCQIEGLKPIDIALKAEKIKDIRIGIYMKHLHVDIIPAHPSKYWLVKKYGNKPIYSGNEKNLINFLKKENYL